MTENTPIRPAGSLIERAAELYDFGRLGAPLSMPIAAPAASQTTPYPPAAAPRVSTMPPVDVDVQLLRQSGFILPDAAPNMLSEEFRLVKRQLLLSAFGGRKTRSVERGRAILVTSSQPNEGKTFCTVNLALSMSSESEIEVLLVDADVAKPEVLSTLGMPGGAGLLDALADPSADPESFIIPTSIPKLSVLPAGRQANNDTELLASDQMHVLVDRLMARNPRRVVIFDTPPTLAASAASVLSGLVGQVLLVVRADRTVENELRESVALLAACPHLQLLINSVTYAGNSQKFGSYYGYGG